MTANKRFLMAVLLSMTVVAITAPAQAATALIADSFNGKALGKWAQYSSHGYWYVNITGYGTAGIVNDGTHVLYEAPKEAKTHSETHSSLITSIKSFGNADLTIRMKTVRQYPRGGTPNTWDVGWILWHWTDATHYYYVALRTNGIVLGKANPSFPGHQKGLAYPGGRFPVGHWYSLHIRQVGNTIDIWANGTHYLTYSDSSAGGVYTKGKLGLCAENSNDRFDDVRVTAA